MNNYEKIKAMTLDEMALEIGATHIAVIQKVSNELTDIVKIDTPLMSLADKKGIVYAVKQWLQQESRGQDENI